MKQVLGYYLLLINAIGLLIMCIDKLLAKKQARRAPGLFFCQKLIDAHNQKPNCIY